MAFAITQCYVNFNITDVTANVTDVTLCELLYYFVLLATFCLDIKVQNGLYLTFYKSNWLVLYVKAVKCPNTV